MLLRFIEVFRYVGCVTLMLGAGLSLASPDEASGTGELDLAALMNLDSQVTSATKIAQSISEAPAIITVISRDKIIDRGYETVAEALGALPGFFVNSDYVLPDAGVRGISGELRGGSRLIKVMLNGQPVSFRSETTNWLNNALVPMDAIDRIEVIRGPGSALYGANAFLGVVNIITRQVDDFDGASFRYQAHKFGENLGQSLSAASGFYLGPVELSLSYQRQLVERSGLRVRCGTTFASDDYTDANDTPCEDHEGRARIEFDLDPSSPTFELSKRSTLDDWDRSSSFLAQAKVDVGELTVGDRGALGTLDLMVNLQRLDVGASFADWGVFTYDTYEDDNSFVANSGNRVALFNDLYAIKWSQSFWDDGLVVTGGFRYAQGGPQASESLRETLGPVERQRSGFEGTDAYLEVFGVPLQDFGDVSWLNQGALIDSWTLMASVDVTQDLIDLVDDAARSATYRRVRPLTKGVLGQSTLSMLNKRVNLVAGLRYDDYQGANLSESAIAGLEDADAERLCESENGRRVCFNKASTRYGLTTVIAKDVLSFGDKEQHLIDELYVKLLYGTAFKAPSSLFLYHEGVLGSVPVNPNPGLLPQDVRSFEALVGGTFLGGYLDLSATLFWNTLENKAEFTKDGVGIIGANSSTIESSGLEIEAKSKWGWGEGYLSLGQQSSEVLADASAGDEKITDTFAFPSLTAVAGLALKFDDYFSRANIEIRHTGERVGYYLTRGGANTVDNRYVLPAYTTIDLVIGSTDFEMVRLKPSRVTLVIKNLMDSQFDYPGFQPYYRVDIPGEPRRFVLTFEQTL